ncbi:frataxin homolog, mitochondrial [Diabrotica virgifera virgifera]|uniref:ferroxidase n=1 Tax=Diabrotica virgifera virgifera TaxID=50390 RepID=A0A6P7G381_DIAVI|nr:frataxin homolog, mitochondrial [Diabrotica virgifera virgifera]
MLKLLRQVKLKKVPKNVQVVSICSHNNTRYFEKNSICAPNFSIVWARKLALSNFSTNVVDEIDSNTFEKVCEKTLESLTDFFEELVESNDKLKSADVSYSSGVLTVNLGQYGTYVINRQSPNKQIWLSSPKSGPKRYDFETNGNYWVYKHDMKTLHGLLQKELTNILGENIYLSDCAYYK